MITEKSNFIECKKLSLKSQHNTTLFIEDYKAGIGEFIVIQGANQSGKSYFFSFLQLLDLPYEGLFSIFQKELRTIDKASKQDLRKKMGFVSKSSIIPEWSFNQHMHSLQLLFPHAIPSLDRPDLKVLYNQPLQSLPKFESKLLQLDLALCGIPEILILEDLFEGLDASKSRQMVQVLESIRAKSKALILVSTLEEIDFGSIPRRNFVITDSALLEKTT